MFHSFSGNQTESAPASCEFKILKIDKIGRDKNQVDRKKGNLEAFLVKGFVFKITRNKVQQYEQQIDKTDRRKVVDYAAQKELRQNVREIAFVENDKSESAGLIDKKDYTNPPDQDFQYAIVVTHVQIENYN